MSILKSIILRIMFSKLKRYIGDNPGKTLVIIIVATFALGVLTSKIFW